MAYIGSSAAPVATSVGPGAVSTPSIVDAAVTSAKIADGAVITQDIANNAVTPAKLANGGAELGFRNRIINGDMRIDQRNAGASVATSSGTSVFGLDRWGALYSQPNKFTMQQNAGSVTPPAGFKNYLGVTSSSAYAVGASEQFVIYQAIEGFNAADLGWGTAGAATITVSFAVRSSLTGTFGGCLNNDGKSRAYPFTYTISTANTWEQKTLTIAGDTSGTWNTTTGAGIYVVFGLGVGSNASTTAGSWTGAGSIFGATGATSVVGTNGATFYITGVQLEAGSVATPFERRDYGRELMMCQRYFRTNGRLQGIWTTAQNIRVTETFPVEMRASPTLGLIDTNGYHEWWNSVGYNGLSGFGFTSGSAKAMDMILISSVTRSRSYTDPAMLDTNVVSYNAEL